MKAETPLKVVGIDCSMNRTGVAVTTLADDYDIPHVQSTRLIVTPHIGAPTLLDQAKKLRVVRDELCKVIAHERPNVVGLERHLFSRGGFSDSILQGLQHLIFNLFFGELRGCVVVPFPVMISPIQIKKWVDCSRHIKDGSGQRLKGPHMKAYLYREIREIYQLPAEMGGDELEAVVICMAISAWAMPDSEYTQSLLPYQTEVVEKLEQQGETDIEGFPGFYEDDLEDKK